MAMVRARSIAPALLATVPLIVLALSILRGAIRPTDPPPGSGGAVPGTSQVAGFGTPDADLPADRLHERVNGAEEYLRLQGCSRLLAWDLTEPAGTLEVFFFDDPLGAATVFAREAGPGRTEGPGDETSADPQSVLFRRGRVYVRLLADPGNPADLVRLLAEAERMDRAIVEGMGRGA